MKNKEIKQYWKEQRDKKSNWTKVASYRSVSTTPNVSNIPKHVEEPYVEHAGGTKKSIAAYRKSCLPCNRY